MWDLEIVDTVVDLSNSTFPEAHADGTMKVLGTVSLIFLLIATTSPHPWLIIPHLAAGYALHSPWFQETWKFYATNVQAEIFLFFVAGVLPCLVYWVNGFFLLLIELRWPNAELQKRIDQFRNRYKVQKGSFLNVVLDGPEHRPGELRVLHVVKNLIIGQVFVLLPLAYLAGVTADSSLGFRNTQGELPSGWEMTIDILLVVIMDEILFYYGHRLCHDVTWLYKHVHKVHHEFQYPCGLVAAYSHPFEMLICNVLPLGAGLWIFKVNYFTACVWACTAMAGTQTHHSGYRWPYTLISDEQPDYHDYHHKEFNVNYGLMGWLDDLHGTSKKYREFQKQKKAEAEKAKTQ